CMTRTTTITREQYEAQALAERSKDLEREAHAGCLSIAETAGILHLHRQSVREMVVKKNLGHRAPGHTGKTAAWHLSLAELREAYPHLTTHWRNRRVQVTPATPAEHREILGNDVKRVTSEVEA
ncbi:MAG: hypothetical protein ACRDG7_12160, partial [Candidatus Limnocylindria bacterium]